MIEVQTLADPNISFGMTALTTKSN